MITAAFVAAEMQFWGKAKGKSQAKGLIAKGGIRAQSCCLWPGMLSLSQQKIPCIWQQ